MNTENSHSFLNRILAGETETLELKASIHDPHIWARLIASFANSEGGEIVVGVKEPAEIIGVNKENLEQLFKKAIHLISPKVPAELFFTEIEGKSVGVIHVPRSDIVALADGSAFSRSGALTQPMAWTQIRKRLPDNPDNKTLDSIARSIAKQTEQIEELREEVKEANSWKSKWRDSIFFSA